MSKRRRKGTSEDVDGEVVSCETMAMTEFDKENPIDPKSYLRDGFREAVWRSNEVRRDVWDMVPKAKRVLNDILGRSVTEENMPVMLKAATYVLDKNILDWPDVSHQTIEVNANIPKDIVEFQPISRFEVLEAARIAMQAEDHHGEGKPGEVGDGED